MAKDEWIEEVLEECLEDIEQHLVELLMVQVEVDLPGKTLVECFFSDFVGSAFGFVIMLAEKSCWQNLKLPESVKSV